MSTDASPEGFGGSLIPLIERFVAGRDGIGADDAHAWADAQHQLGADGEFFSCCAEFCFTSVSQK